MALRGVSGKIEFVPDSLGQLGTAGHRAADRIDGVRGELAGQRIDEWTQSFALGEKAIKFEPVFAVVTGLHLKVAASAREKSA